MIRYNTKFVIQYKTEFVIRYSTKFSGLGRSTDCDPAAANVPRLSTAAAGESRQKSRSGVMRKMKAARETDSALRTKGSVRRAADKAECSFFWSVVLYISPPCGVNSEQFRDSKKLRAGLSRSYFQAVIFLWVEWNGDGRRPISSQASVCLYQCTHFPNFRALASSSG